MTMCTLAKDHHLEESANDESLDDREIQLSSELKELCNDKGIETNIQKSAKVWHQLGRVYQKRARLWSSPDLFAVIRSAVLFKAAIVRKPDNVTEIEEDLRELCSHVLMSSGAEHGDASLTDKAQSVMTHITKLREKIKKKLDDIDIIEKHELETTIVKRNKVNEIEKLQCEISDWYRETMKEVMEYCLSVQGRAPCEYALIGMGSLARKEITPYSDFEHAILLEDGVQCRTNFEEILEYFRWVSGIFQLVIVNLGETIPPNINLPYLNNPHNEELDWFFDDYTTRGISFDGMTPYACKFPLGRTETPNKRWKVELIHPVTKMLKYLGDEEDLKNGYHLADMLMNTCYVSGNQRIHDTFCLGVRKFLQENCSTASLKQQIVQDTKNFNPINSLDRASKKKKWNMKRVVYRSTTLFIAALGRCYKLSSSSSFDLVRQLEQVFRDDDFALNLLLAVAIACHVRLIAYFEKQRQDDWLEVEQFDNQFVQLMDTKTALLYFQTAMKLQREACNKIGLQSCEFVQLSPSLDYLLVCFWLQQRQDAIEEAERIYSDQKSTKEMEIVHEVVLMTGNQYYEEKKYIQALRCFNISYAHNSSHTCEDDSAHCLHWIGRCLFRVGDFEKALKHYEKELDMRLQINKARHIRRDEHRPNLSYSLEQLSLTDKVSEPFQQATDRRTSDIVEEISLWGNLSEVKYQIGQCLCRQGKYNIALKSHEEALNIRKSMIHHNKTHLERSYRAMAACYFNMEEFKDASRFLQEAILTISGNPLLTSNIALYRNLMGNCLFEQKNYEEAIMHYEVAVNTRKSIGDDENVDVIYAEFCHDMAVCLFELEEFQKAITYFEIAKAIQKNVSGLIFKYGENANWIGDCLYEQEKYSDALVHYKEAVNIGESAFDGTNGDEMLAEFYHDMGACLYKLEEFQDALIWFEKENTIQMQNSELSLKSAENANWIGGCFYKQGKYSEALVHYKEAVNIGKDFRNDENGDETYTDFCHDVGKCLFKVKKYQDAIIWFEKAMTIQGEHLDLLLNYAENSNKIGDCFYKLESHPKAKFYYEEAADVQNGMSEDKDTDEKYAKFCKNLGVCLFKLEMFEEAKHFFETAKTVQTNNGDLSLASKIAENSNWIDKCSRALAI